MTLQHVCLGNELPDAERAADGIEQQNPTSIATPPITVIVIALRAPAREAFR